MIPCILALFETSNSNGVPNRCCSIATPWTALRISCSVPGDSKLWIPPETSRSWRNSPIIKACRVRQAWLYLSFVCGKTDRKKENLLHYYLPSLAPYFPSFLHPRRSPKANKYVLEMASQQNPNAYTLIEKLTRTDSPLHPSQAAAECKDHMAAGIDTTGDGLCFLMWQLSQPENEPFQTRLRNELRSAPANVPIDSLPYLDAVIKEALRLTPPIPMSLPRYVPVGGREIDGFFIPEGTIVSSQPYTVHRFDEEIFPDPERFNPERWMEEKGANERNRLFFAFAIGGRGCTGRK